MDDREGGLTCFLFFLPLILWRSLRRRLPRFILFPPVVSFPSASNHEGGAWYCLCYNAECEGCFSLHTHRNKTLGDRWGVLGVYRMEWKWIVRDRVMGSFTSSLWLWVVRCRLRRTCAQYGDSSELCLIRIDEGAPCCGYQRYIVLSPVVEVNHLS